MKRISSSEAKAHLNTILSDVAAGEEYIITWHNKDIARLAPYKEEKNVKQAIENIKKMRLRYQLSFAEGIKSRDRGKR